MKTTLKYFLVFLIIPMFSIPSLAQYKLQQAFPNLSTFNNPVELVHADDGTNKLFVVQQRGIIYIFNNSSTVNARKTFLDLSSIVSQMGPETGSLGLAFHPDYENNRYSYVNYTFDSSGVVWSRISRFSTSLSNPDSALFSSELYLITLRHPFLSHKGGKVAFGPDGYLYISFGDGGGSGDPQGNGQNRATLLGKILRINIDSSANGNSYSIPTSNPYFGNSQGFKEEIYAYGFRNIWKFSFDFPTGRLWAGDVGQSFYEEIDLIENGKNYGWNKMEGFHCYGACDTTGKGFTRPIFEYSHNIGFAITGGYVYRGALLPGLYGKYIYADYSLGKIWALTYDGINPPVNVLLLDSTYSISSLGIAQEKELYVISYSPNGNIYKLYNTNVITLDLKLAIEGFYNLKMNSLSIKDSIKVYLHQSTVPFVVVDSAKTVIDSLSLSGLCFFNIAPTGKYYIKIKHRNGLETWSKSGGDSLKKGNVTNYDFTTNSSQAFGSNQILKGIIYCIYSGDINQDGIIDIQDLSLADNDSYNFASGYLDTDVNGDNYVDVSDVTIIDNNAYDLITKITP